MRKCERCLFYRYRPIWINSISFCIFVIIFIVLFISFFVKFSFCYRYDGLVIRKGDDFYVSILVDNNWFDLQNLPLVVDKERTSYSIISIDSDYVVTNFGLKKQVILEFDIDDDKKIVNNVLNLYFIRNMTFFKKIKEMIV